MKPEQFIREYGPNTFRISMSFVNTAKYLVVHEGEIDFTDEIKPHHGDRVFERDVVKRLVESVDLVESWGGIEDLKLYDLSHCKDKPESAGYKLLQAIADYESIYGGGQ
ncbi:MULTISPECIES: hypothetical protein [Acinetobacter calcoaceticus/baumannii complex]|jgi:hypothetical protein|uniref:hypothetical protein n=1 Tax=Acinetobacter calcoaceticus/baumannii complex TaxID=909768 RepID=UPI0007357974|nr:MULTISPECIES: hypothetical protein [Acinetobacter calcoaceticus/baumannii complex]EHU1527918.1 hypothetical protein [Acinetobacter baumannii]EHU1539806.1 hypothetical protein [Acinetobacter baumannii]EHU2002758.1 hypothetical protein [Acinetobacter baumannii]MCJ9178424.1 hypothetical protein [Acinetobacter baumannii]MCJ9182366.1 hypothetical protein [Acinetobacter baumannii]